MKPFGRLHIFILVILAVAGCTPTKTAIQVPTLTAIFPASTIIPTATATFTPLATLEPKQAEEILQSLLVEPEKCSSPCFWGITPQMTIDEAINAFSHLGVQVPKTLDDDKDFYAINYDFDNGLSVGLMLIVHDRVIESLRVVMTPERQKTGALRAWSAYSLETLIAKYGEPSRVNFILDRGPNFSITSIMFYDALGLIIEYSYSTTYDQNDLTKICPLTVQFDSVRIWIGKEPYYPPLKGVSLEKATSITMEEFSKLMLGDPSKACFNLKDEAFP